MVTKEGRVRLRHVDDTLDGFLISFIKGEM